MHKWVASNREYNVSYHKYTFWWHIDVREADSYILILFLDLEDFNRKILTAAIGKID